MSASDDKKHIIVFALITALCLFGDSMLYIVLPVHYEEAGLSSLWEVGIILAVNRIVRLPLNPCIGWFYRHVSERTGILIAVVLATGTTLSYGFLDSFWLWVLARCVWGVAWTLLRLGSLFCILKISTPANRGQFNGLYNGLYRLGSLVGMLFGGFLADAAGLRATAVVFGVASALSVILAVLYIPKGMDEEVESSSDSGLVEGLRMILRDNVLLWVIITGGIIAFALQGALAATLSRLIDVHTGGDVSMWGFAVGAASLAGIFQALRWAWEPWLAPLVGKISDSRLGWRRMFVYTSASAVLFFALLALPLPLAIWFVCILGMQLTATALTTVADAAASDSAANACGRVLLMHYALIVDIGSALGPIVAYGLNAILGINAVYFFCAALFAPLVVVWQKRVLAKN